MDKLTWYHPDFRLLEDQQIHDHPRETSAGYSFVTDPRNFWNHRPSLVQHILQTPDLSGKFVYISPGGSLSWIPTAVASFLKQIFDLQTKILCNIILSYGEPARGTELVSHLLTNVAGGSIRNFFVLFNTPFLRGSFSKTTPTQGSDKTICRFPLPELGRQFIRFLVYLRPLYLEWQSYLNPHMVSNARDFLFAGLYQPLESKYLSKALAAYTEKELGVHLSLRTYRQFMVFISNSNHAVFAAAAEENSGLHEQFGHSLEINTTHYGHDARTPHGTNIKSFFLHARISGVFHLLYGHPPTLLEALQVGKTRILKLVSAVHEINGRPYTSQSQAVIPAGVSRTSIDDSSDLLFKMRQVFESSLAKAHAAVADLFVGPISKHPQAAGPSSLTGDLPIVVHPSLVKILRSMYPSLHTNAAFSNIQQAQVTQLLLEGKRHVAYIAPTGMWCFFRLFFECRAHLFSQEVARRLRRSLLPNFLTRANRPSFFSPSSPCTSSISSVLGNLGSLPSTGRHRCRHGFRRPSSLPPSTRLHLYPSGR